MEHVVIIGNGISGVTAARYIRKLSDKKITMISAESKYFFSRTALMYVYMGHMRFKDTQPYEPSFWKKNDIDIVEGFVDSIDHEGKSLHFSDHSTMSYDKLILAVGSKPNKFGWKGEDLDGVQGLYSKQDLELLESNTKNCKTAVIVGGGLIGVELAEMLLTRNIKVQFLIREDRFWGGVLPEADSRLVERHMRKHHGLQLRFEDELEEIIGDETGRVDHIITKNGEKIDCQLVGLTAGVRPNIDFLESSAIETNRGILVNEDLTTNIEDIYAIGDCAEFRVPNGERKPIEQVWYTGRMMGETVAQTICGSHTSYSPGHWFNSAKFFDLEYQTYGWVWNTLKDDEAEFIWQNKEKELLLHFVFDKNSHVIKGVNTFGIRLRHEVFDHWLTIKASIEEVLTDLKAANFDPEFYKRYEEVIISEFNSKFGTTLNVRKRSWWKNTLNKLTHANDA
tara:strand:+ start:20410 stop:21765 length:1356 start_codon:yes stop_codon:yes gene_type:complete